MGKKLLLLLSFKTNIKKQKTKKKTNRILKFSYS